MNMVPHPAIARGAPIQKSAQTGITSRSVLQSREIKRISKEKGIYISEAKSRQIYRLLQDDHYSNRNAYGQWSKKEDRALGGTGHLPLRNFAEDYRLFIEAYSLHVHHNANKMQDIEPDPRDEEGDPNGRRLPPEEPVEEEGEAAEMEELCKRLLGPDPKVTYRWGPPDSIHFGGKIISISTAHHTGALKPPKVDDLIENVKTALDSKDPGQNGMDAIHYAIAVLDELTPCLRASDPWLLLSGPRASNPPAGKLEGQYGGRLGITVMLRETLTEILDAQGN
jgi:hypothetical protein